MASRSRPSRHTRLATFVATTAVALAVAACGSARRGEPIAGAMNLDDPSIRHGRLLFDTYCYKCHTEGEGGMGPIINDKSLPKFLMRFQVRHGLGTMPAFSKEQIGDRDLEDILDYLVVLRQHGQQAR
jgi:mono/diheme cytochrome c family protein